MTNRSKIQLIALALVIATMPNAFALKVPLSFRLPLWRGKSGGEPAFLAVLQDKEPDPSLLTTECLEYIPNGEKWTVVRDTKKCIRQVSSEKGLVDVITISSSAYHVRWYKPEQMGKPDSMGLYLPSGSPTHVAQVTGPGKDSRNYIRVHLLIREGENVMDDVMYSFNNFDKAWEAVRGKAYMREQVLTDPQTGDSLDVEEVVDSTGRIIRHELCAMRRFPFGNGSVMRSQGPPGLEMTTRNYYHMNPKDKVRYGKERLRLVNDGRYYYYPYDDQGKKLSMETWWPGNPAAPPVWTIHCSSTPVDPKDDGTLHPNGARKEVVKEKGEVMAVSYNAFYRDIDGKKVYIREECPLGTDLPYGSPQNRRAVFTW